MRRSPRGRPGRSRLFRSAAALPYLTISSAILVLLHVWFIYIACSRRVHRSEWTNQLQTLRSFPPGAFVASVSQGFRVGARRPPNGLMNAVRSRPRFQRCVGSPFSESACRRPWFLSFVCRTEHFARNYQGVSHAKWPKAKHECAPTETGSVICCPLKAVDVECRPPRVDRPSKRAKKLRAVSGARPHRSPNRQRSRGRELLPVRRTLFQIDVLGFRTNVTTFAATATCGQGEPSMIRVSMSPTAMFGPGGGLTFTTNTVATLLAGDTLVGWS
jgi:hypothetical protein